MLRITLPGLCLAVALPTMAQTILIPDTNLRYWLNLAKPNSVDANGYCDTATWNAQPPSEVDFSLVNVSANSTVDFEGLQYLKMPLLSIGDSSESNITLLWPGHPRNNTVLSISTVLVEDIVGPFFPLPDSLLHFTCNACGLVDLPPFSGQELEVKNVDLSGQVLTVPPSVEQLTLENCSLTELPDLAGLTNLHFLTINANPLLAWPPAWPPYMFSLHADEVGLSNMPSTLPSNFHFLHLSGNGMTELAWLPQTLMWLQVDHNELTSLPPLPAGLSLLHVRYNPLTGLPTLPASLSNLDVGFTALTTLPGPLPSDLVTLNVEGSNVSSLPSLPNGILILMIPNTPIVELPLLPEGLLSLYANNATQLTCLPTLPATLIMLQLSGSGVSCLPNIPPDMNTGWALLGIPAVVCDVTNTCPPSDPVITGTTFVDADANGVFDTGESPLPFSMVVAQPGGLLAGSDLNGHYVLPADIGDFSVTGVEPLYAPLSTAPYNVSFTAPGQVDSLNHIGFTPIPDVYDLVTGLVGGPVRPGFYTQLWINGRNVGTEHTTAQIQLVFDAELSWVGSTQTPNDQIGNTATWSIADLAPGDTWCLRVTLYAPPTLALGTPITQQLDATPAQPDETPVDNTCTLNDVVVGSYDPNDKRVEPTMITPQDVDMGTRVHYTVRFQNTGTFPAERVLITDTLSGDLQPMSVQLTGSSHPCTWYLRHGVLHMLFEGINLPDSVSDEAGSHGFVSFSFLPVTTLLPGASVNNVANIYFDFNAPVITNEAVFTVDASTATGPGISGEDTWKLWPNPVRNTLCLQAGEPLIGQVDVLDATGRIVIRERAAGTQLVLGTSSLGEGVYTLRCSTAQGPWSARFVKH